MKLIKKDFFNILTEEYGIDNETACNIIGRFIETISDCLSSNGSIEIRGLGSMFLRKSNKTIVRNINKNEVMHIAPKNRPTFKPSPLLLKKCN